MDSSNVSFWLNGCRWEARAEFAEFVRHKVAPNLERLEELEGSELIKENSGRALFRIDAPGARSGALVVKRHRVRDWKEALKYLFVSSRGRTEWRVLHALQAAGIPCPNPVAVGELRRLGVLQRACLIVEHIPNVGDLASVLQSEALREKERRALIEKLGETVRAMHDHGFDHRDLHARNVLVGGNAGQLWILDHHRVRVCKEVSRRARARGLAMLIVGAARLAELGRLMRSYLLSGHERLPKSEAKRFVLDVLRQFDELRQIHFRSRTRRCLQGKGDFAREEMGRSLVYRKRAFPLSWVRAAMQLHDEALRAQRKGVIKSDVKTAVSKVALPGVESLCVKEFKMRSLPIGLWRRLTGSKARKAWRAAHGLRLRGIGTVEPLACVENRRAGISQAQSFFISTWAEGYRTVKDVLLENQDSSAAPAEREALLDKAAEVLARMHATGAHHGDFRFANLLARRNESGWEILVLDLQDVNLGHFPSARERSRSLRQLCDRELVTEIECARIKEAYARRRARGNR